MHRHACMNACTHTRTYRCHCCRAKHALYSELSQVHLPHFYVFIHIHTPFVVFHIFFYVSFGKKPNSFWERAHFCQEAASHSPSRCVSVLPWVKLCCTTRRSLGAIRAGEGCSRSRAVRQFTYLDWNPKVLSHRDVWQRTLSHGSAGEVFIRRLCLNRRKAESSLCVILLAGSHTSWCPV